MTDQDAINVTGRIILRFPLFHTETKADRNPMMAYIESSCIANVLTQYIAHFLCV